MFFVIDNIDIASYSDDNTPYSVGKNQYSSTRKNFPIYTPNIKTTFNECLFYVSI